MSQTIPGQSFKRRSLCARPGLSYMNTLSVSRSLVTWSVFLGLFGAQMIAEMTWKRYYGWGTCQQTKSGVELACLTSTYSCVPLSHSSVQRLLVMVQLRGSCWCCGGEELLTGTLSPLCHSSPPWRNLLPPACTNIQKKTQPSTCVPGCKCPTFKLGLDKVKHLAEAVLKGKGLNSHGLQLLTLLLVEVLQLVHAQHPVPVQVHAAEPVLHARNPQQTQTTRSEN